LFVYTQKGSIISTVDLPTTEIIEPKLNELKVFVILERLLRWSGFSFKEILPHFLKIMLQ
uniref:hypothetical protein n=1 Tax=Streptococcus suis TaxID=1307 RepID=UPI001C55811F